MKTFSLLLSFLLLCFVADAQRLTTTVDSYTGDSIVSTGFDTLKTAGAKNGIADRVVGVKTIHKGKSTYWLFFYFSTSDITKNPVTISNRNFAYFVLTNGEYLRFPYSGRANNYTAKDNAGFFIDITNSFPRLQSARIKMLRFETSTFYHEIVLTEEKQLQIAALVNRLINK